MLHNHCGVKRVVSEMSVKTRDWIIELSGEPVETWHGRTEKMLGRAASAAGISFRSARSLFWPQGNDPRGSTVEKVRRAIEKRRLEKEEAAREETRDLFDRIAALEAYLCQVDPEFRREHLAGAGTPACTPISEEG